MYRSLYRRVLLPSFEDGLKRRQTFRYWRELDRTQWLARAELEQLQFDALRRLLQHAYNTCPYYRETWDRAGLDPHNLQSRDDFSRWPLIDREVIREHRETMRSRAPGLRLLSKSTGGSTGVPLHFDLDSGSHDRRTAAWHRGYDWAAAAPGTKQLYLWGVPVGVRTRRRRLKDDLYNRFYRRKVLNTFELSDERIPDFLRCLNRYRPDAIVAYVGPLYSFARSLEERGLKAFSPQSIVVGAEKLHAFQRELIERVFQAPVFETYGSREVMLMGAECDRHEGLHLTAENLLIEVLDDEGGPTPPGQQGNVVVSDLTNYGMPFIRYVNGDRAVAGWRECSCGRGLPLLREVVGRQADMIRTPDGRLISGLYFPHFMKEFPAIRRFLVVQDEPGHVELRLVVGAGWIDDDRRRLERGVRDILGPEIDLDLKPVDQIPLSVSGKQRVVLNLCDPGAAGLGAVAPVTQLGPVSTL